MQGIRESAGWGPASWLSKSNFVEFKDTNRSPSFSGNWRRWSPLSRRLSNGERHRRVGYARAATFHGVSGDSGFYSQASFLPPIVEVHKALLNKVTDIISLWPPALDHPSQATAQVL